MSMLMGIPLQIWTWMLRLVFDVGVFVHVCVDEEVVGGRRGNGMSTFLVKTVMGKNSDDDVYSLSCARPRRRQIHRFRHMHT